MEDIETKPIPLEILIVLCAKSFMSGGTLEDIDPVSLLEMRDQLDLEIAKRRGTIH